MKEQLFVFLALSTLFFLFGAAISASYFVLAFQFIEGEQTYRSTGYRNGYYTSSYGWTQFHSFQLYHIFMGPITAILYIAALALNFSILKPVTKGTKKGQLTILMLLAAAQLASASIFVSVQEYEYAHHYKDDHYEYLQFCIIAGFCCFGVLVLLIIFKAYTHFEPTVIDPVDPAAAPVEAGPVPPMASERNLM